MENDIKSAEVDTDNITMNLSNVIDDTVFGLSAGNVEDSDILSDVNNAPNWIELSKNKMKDEDIKEKDSIQQGVEMQKVLDVSLMLLNYNAIRREEDSSDEDVGEDDLIQEVWQMEDMEKDDYKEEIKNKNYASKLEQVLSEKMKQKLKDWRKK